MLAPQEVLQDFRNHIYFCFKYLRIGEPTAIQYEIARQLQEGPIDQILVAGRGTGKSTITACMASWYWLKDPESTFLVLSNTQGKAIDFVSQARKILNLVPYCNHLIPKDTDKDNALGFNIDSRTRVTQDLSCAARGITSQITGLHSDCIILDDIEIEGKNDTPVTKEILMNKLRELESIRNKGSRVVFLGTPHYQDSIYNFLKIHYPMIKYPAEFPETTISSQVEDVAPWILGLGLTPGDPTQPERFGIEELANRKAKIGPSAYSLQYKLDTTLNDMDKYPLKLRDLIILDLDHTHAPDKVVWQGVNTLKHVQSHGLSGDLMMEPMYASPSYTPYQHMHMCIDPSGRGADETGVCISGVLSGTVYILELLGIPGGYSDATLKKIVSLVQEYNIPMLRIEANFGDGLFSKVLVPFLENHGCKAGIEEFKVSGQKELRIIEVMEPAMNQHRVVFSSKAIKDPENQHQITRIHKGRGALQHDDRIDVLASAVSFYRDHMVVHSDTNIEKMKKKAWEKEIKEWATDFRAGKYIPCSGAIRESSRESKKLIKKSQWGW